jgi:hypothetical protein
LFVVLTSFFILVFSLPILTSTCLMTINHKSILIWRWMMGENTGSKNSRGFAFLCSPHEWMWNQFCGKSVSLVTLHCNILQFASAGLYSGWQLQAHSFLLQWLTVNWWEFTKTNIPNMRNEFMIKNYYFNHFLTW